MEAGQGFAAAFGSVVFCFGAEPSWSFVLPGSWSAAGAGKDFGEGLGGCTTASRAPCCAFRDLVVGDLCLAGDRRAQGLGTGLVFLPGWL